MDIRKLIEGLRSYTYWLGQDGPESHDIHPIICDDAATALSTLQAENEKLRAELEQVKAERDAALEHLHGICSACKNYSLYHNRGKCRFCAYEPARDKDAEVNDNWEWRGPQRRTDMALWDYCAICGKRIESGEPCLGIERKNTELFGDSICFGCTKIENLPDGEKPMSITDLLARAEAAEVRHGRWSSNGIALVCSECGRAFGIVEMFAHYCPWCGSRMDKEDEYEAG